MSRAILDLDVRIAQRVGDEHARAARGGLPISVQQFGVDAELSDGERPELHLERDQTTDGRLDGLRHGPGALVGLDVGGDAAQHAQDESAGAHGGIGHRHAADARPALRPKRAARSTSSTRRTIGPTTSGGV